MNRRLNKKREMKRMSRSTTAHRTKVPAPEIGLALILLLLFSELAVAQRIVARGFVETNDGQPVRHTEVRIHTGPHSTTGDSGDFTILFDSSSPANIKVGYPVIFQVSGWIIEDPRMGERGRLYLPDPNAEPLKLRVRKSGDRAFLQPQSIEDLLGRRVYEFGSSNQNSLREFLGPPSIKYVTATNNAVNGQREPEKMRRVPPDWRPFLDKNAQEIGIPLDQLVGAIETWIGTAHSPYQRGLAAIYREQYGPAADAFRLALGNASPDSDHLYVSFAYAEFKNGEFDQSKSALQYVIDRHPMDMVLKNNLSVVSSALLSQKYVDEENIRLCNAIMLDLVQREFDVVHSRFSDSLRKTFPDTRLKDILDANDAKSGRFLYISDTKAVHIEGRTFYVVKSQFERKLVDLRLLFDQQGKVAGMWLYPEDTLRKDLISAFELLGLQGGYNRNPSAYGGDKRNDDPFSIEPDLREEISKVCFGMPWLKLNQVDIDALSVIASCGPQRVRFLFDPDLKFESLAILPLAIEPR